MRPPSLPLLLALALLCPLAAHAELGINVYGLSYHFDRDKAKRLGTDNELNPGLGLRWKRPLDPSWDFFVDAGAYHDSGKNTALLAGAGVLWRATESLRLGGALAAIHSDTYNRGKAFVAPLPVVAFDLNKRVTLNMVYLPKVRDFNEINTLGFWATVWLDPK